MLNRKTRVAGFLAVILLICAGGWFYYQRTQPDQGGSTQRIAPVFQLKDHSGEVHTLSEAKGKLVLVHFWAAWCPPCLSEIPDLVEFAQKMSDDPKFQIFTVSMDDHWKDAEKVLNSTKLPKNMVSLLDGGAKTPDLYGTYQFPETYLVSPDGKILAKWVGAQPWSNPKTIELMRNETSKLATRR